MPTATFKTTVSVSGESKGPGQVAVANCASYLAYADQTDTFGYHGKVYDLVMPTPMTVKIWWEAPVANRDEIQKVADEMSRLSRVESHECITNATNAEI